MVKKKEVADKNNARQNPKALKISTKLLLIKTFRFFKRKLNKKIFINQKWPAKTSISKIQKV